MSLLAIDIGTTHIKAGLFKQDGELLQLAIYQNKSYQNEQGYFYYKPDEIWDTVTKAIKHVTTSQNENVSCIGITSMAESGLVIDSETGSFRSEVIPWFDRRTERISSQIEKEVNPLEHFQKTGLRNNYKHGLAKLLWLKQHNSDALRGAKWLSTSDFIAYMLTGKMGTDYTLAARTFSFRIDQKNWDVPWIRHFGLHESLFPEARPSGTKVGEIASDDFDKIGLKKGIPVAVSGHDHICAALAVGAVKPGFVSDSVGTAETLVGAFNERALTLKDYESGLNFGCHALPNTFFWMGAIQSSGGSVEWLRDLLSTDVLSYEDIVAVLDETPKHPTGILYYPYLAGSGSPYADSNAKGAFIGLTSRHGKGDLIRALLEGTAYEFEHMKQAVESYGIAKISKIFAAGGGTKNHHWMQIKADVSNCSLTIPSIQEATLLGAAIIAGLGCGIYKDEKEIARTLSRDKGVEIIPNEENHLKYRKLFEDGYLPLQKPLRSFYQKEW
ncbi:FGGY-family carbohydrate kinase [Metabacillus halosaccharovorans]|uniref:FGGY family carbohydrate kinase n=1 Tax=Metabacillus halosaccharovorans TaxID=930124 RepID=A0ABT3DBV4_9BACI|nr:FGGY family carbohydrate kinase [Metabacillus halosaccharovorans]MCV9884542.1 FGGY family carbohydrate kinase [Metabacillus halosaccharovorans]